MDSFCYLVLELIIPGQTDDGAAPASTHAFGLLDLGDAATADPVQHHDRLSGEVGLAVRLQPLKGHRDRAGGCPAGRSNEDKLVGDCQKPRHGGRGWIG